MIAIQTNECLYIINMEFAEFLESAANDALWESNPMIKAKTEMTLYNNNGIHFLNSSLSEIKCCARLVGDQFTLSFKPLESVKDLEFFIKDGKQYSCEQSFVFDEAKGKTLDEPVRVNAPLNPEVKTSAPLSPEIPSPEVKTSAPLSPEIPSPEVKENSEKGAAPAPEKGGEEPLKKGGDDEPPKDEAEPEEESLDGEETEEEKEEEESLGGEGTGEESEEEFDVAITEDQKKAAAALDNLLHRFPNINDLSEEQRKSMMDYVESNKRMFREISRKYLEDSSYHENIDNLSTNYFVPNALGEEQEMLDSLLVFPEMVHILAKFDMSRSFSPSSIINSTFMRICPIGETISEEGKRYSAFIQEFKITKEDYKEAERLILERYELRSLRGLTSEQKQLYLEEALEMVYNRKYGSIASQERRILVDDADEYLQKYAKSYYFPDYLTWTQIGQVEYDAREKIDHVTVPIITQLQNHNVIKKITKSVRIPVIRTDGALPSEFFVEVNEDYLTDVKDSIIDLPDGRILKGYFWDETTKRRITEQEYMDILEEKEASTKLGGSSEEKHEEDTSTKLGGSSEEKHEEDTSTKLGGSSEEKKDGLEQSSGTLFSDTLNVQNLKFGGRTITSQPLSPEIHGEETTKKDDLVEYGGIVTKVSESPEMISLFFGRDGHVEIFDDMKFYELAKTVKVGDYIRISKDNSEVYEIENFEILKQAEPVPVSSSTSEEADSTEEKSTILEAVLEDLGFKKAPDGSYVNQDGNKLTDDQLQSLIAYFGTPTPDDPEKGKTLV